MRSFDVAKKVLGWVLLWSPAIVVGYVCVRECGWAAFFQWIGWALALLAVLILGFYLVSS